MSDTPSPEFLALQSAVAGRYSLVSELGRGGMGVVFLARDVALDRAVAIKLLPPHLCANPELRRRFVQEARIAARLAHPNIVPIHAVEEHDGLVLFVMGYIAGMTLAERVRGEGPLDPPAVARLVQEVAWALAYAHRNGVVHRDIKPENILIERGTGRIVVTDFGIARLAEAGGSTPPGEIVGTARYMSPEQATGGPVDGRSDLYSLGVTAFFALTGRHPFEAESAAGQLSAHLMLPAPPVASLRPGLPHGVAAAIDKCLAKQPAERFADGEALAEAVSIAGGTARTPEVLARLGREASALGVDIAGYATLVGTSALMALIHQWLGVSGLTTGLEFAGAWLLAAIFVTLTTVKAISATRLVRAAVREGWTHEDFAAAVRQEALAEEHRAREHGQRPLAALQVAGIFAGGLLAVILLMLGPLQTLENLAGSGVLGVAVAFLDALLPIGLGRWLGARLEAPRAGRPGLFSRLILVKAKLLFRIARLGLRKPATHGLPPSEPTERVLADAARVLLAAIPDARRDGIGNAADVIRQLERDAQALRAQEQQLDAALADIGAAGSEGRREARAELEGRRSGVVKRLAEAVAALDGLRLDLLRLRAGAAPRDDLTESLEAAARIGREIDQGLEAGSEVERPSAARRSPPIP